MIYSEDLLKIRKKKKTFQQKLKVSAYAFPSERQKKFIARLQKYFTLKYLILTFQ